MGQLISNTATALIIIPIGVAAAASMGISPRPVLMSTAVAAAAAFLTPIATPTNLMVMGPGGYAFGDYWKLGLPLLIWFFVVSVFIVPLDLAFLETDDSDFETDDFDFALAAASWEPEAGILLVLCDGKALAEAIV